MSPRADERDTLHDAETASRVRMLDADGHRWRVSEVPAPQLDRRGGMHLLFDAEVIMRRVRDFPEDWFELPDEALYALTIRDRRAG